MPVMVQQTNQIEVLTTGEVDQRIAAAISSQGATPRGHISGLEVNCSLTDLKGVIISPGVCSSTGDSPVSMSIAVGISKTLSAAWAAGDGGGLLDSGTVQPNTSYHIFAIADGEPTDFLASTSPANPALPDGFTHFRRIRSVKTDAASNIIPTHQIGGWCFFLTPPTVWGAEVVNTTAKLLSTGIPTGVKFQVEAFVQGTTVSGTGYLAMSDPDLGNAEIFDACLTVGSSAARGGTQRVWTDTLGRISFYANTTVTMGNCFIRSWWDPRDV